MPTDAIECVTPRRLSELLPAYPVQYWRTLLRLGRIPGAVKIGSRWLIPITAIQALLESGRDRAA
jgi:hypothetical protein